MRQWTAAALVLAFVGLSGPARAEDKANPNGTWKWTVKFSDQERDLAVKLKADGEKLTGKFIGRDGKETAIEEGKYKEGEVAFKVTLERGGSKIIIKFNGKVGDDSIKGKTEFTRDGETMTRDWEAKRE